MVNDKRFATFAGNCESCPIGAAAPEAKVGPTQQPGPRKKRHNLPRQLKPPSFYGPKMWLIIKTLAFFSALFLTFELIASFQHFSYLLWTTIRLLLPAHFLQRNTYYGIDSIDMVRHV